MNEPTYTDALPRFSVVVNIDKGYGTIIVRHSIISAASKQEAFGKEMMAILSDPAIATKRIAGHSILPIP